MNLDALQEIYADFKKQNDQIAALRQLLTDVQREDKGDKTISLNKYFELERKYTKVKDELRRKNEEIEKLNKRKGKAKNEDEWKGEPSHLTNKLKVYSLLYNILSMK